VQRLVLIAVVVAALAGGGVGVTHTAIFAARTITVKGESHLSEPAVLKLAGVHPGTNVFYLDAGAVRARLIADPWVADATVVRSLPSTVLITIDEVRPVGITASAQDPMLLAQDGTVLGPAPANTRLPVVGTAGDSRASGATTALGAMPTALLVRVRSVTVAVGGRITLTLRDGVIVTYGDAGEADRKAQALRAVITWARNQPIGVISIDVSSPAVPTARLRGATAATAVAPPTPSGSPVSPSSTRSP
jgi:cell division protein FtsQ